MILRDDIWRKNQGNTLSTSDTSNEPSGDHGRDGRDLNSNAIELVVSDPSRGDIKKLHNHLFAAVPIT